jgi:hypothetical protein
LSHNHEIMKGENPMSTGESDELNSGETKDAGPTDEGLIALVKAVAELPPGFSGVIECEHDDGTCRRCHRITVNPTYPAPAPPPAPM